MVDTLVGRVSSSGQAGYDTQSSDLARACEQLELRRRLLQVVARISTLIARTPDLSAALLEGLGMIGEAGHFSRCLLLQRQSSSVFGQDDGYKVVAEWCAPGVRSHHDCGTGTIASDDAANFIHKLRHGETFWCRIDEVEERLRPVFERMEIRATGCAPIMVDDELWGTLAFDDCVRDDPWDEAHVDALTAVANAISNALQSQHRAEQVSIERAKAARERAVELELANQALRRGIAGLGQLDDLSLFLGEMLKAAVTTVGAHSGGVVLLDSSAQTYRVYPLLRAHGGFEPPDTVFTSVFPLSAGVRSIIQDVDATSTAWVPVQVDPRMDPEFIAFHKLEGNQLIAHIPMRAGERLLGMLGLGFPTREPQFDKEFSLLRSLADQMAMAVEMVRLSEEAKSTAVAREREKAALDRSIQLAEANAQLALRDRLLTASAKALEHLMSTSVFAQGVHEALRQIGEAAELSRVKVLLQDRSNDSDPAHTLLYEWWAEGLQSQASLGYVSFPDAIFQKELDQLRSENRWWGKVEDWPEAIQPAFRTIGVSSVGIVPIYIQQEYVGLIAFDQSDPHRDWSEPEIDALTIAARGLGAALSQERIKGQLAQERERAAQEQATELVKANYALRSSVDDLVTQTTTDGILTSLLKQAIEISGANSGAILRRVKGSEFEYVTIYANGEIRSSQAILAAGTNAEMRLASRLDPTGHFAALAKGEARWRDAADEVLGRYLPRSSAFHRGVGNQRIYDFPYKVAGTVFGYLGLAFNDRNPPSEVVQETIKALATQVGLALEFRRISEQVERAAILEERNKVARDLHDSLAQGFAGILMQLGAAEQISPIPVELRHYLTRIDELARTSLSEARRTVNELRTSCQVRDALPRRLADLAARLGSSYGQLVQLSINGRERCLVFEVEEELFSITQESLTNALKHAGATEINLELAFFEDEARLRIKDNGIGFSSEQRRKDGHFGLQTMQERSQRINATMTIISEKGFGTEILILWKQ